MSDDEFDFDEDFVENNQEEQKEDYTITEDDELYNTYCLKVGAMEDFDQYPIQKFSEQYYSGVFLLRIVALRQIPGIVAFEPLDNFEEKIYELLIQSASTFTNEFDVTDKIISFENLIAKDESPAKLANSQVDMEILYTDIANEEEIFIEKLIILELLPQLFHTILYKKSSLKNIFKSQILNTLKYIFPLLLALIKSTPQLSFISRCYQILKEFLTEIRSLVKQNQSNFIKFEPHKNIFLNENAENIYDEFLEIISYYFLLFPFISSQIINYRVKSVFWGKLISGKELAGISIIQGDDYLFLRTCTFPHYENADEFLDTDACIPADKVEIVFNIIRKFPIQFNDFYTQKIVEMVKFIPIKAATPIMTILIKQLSGRPIYGEFLEQIVYPLFNFQGSFISHYIQLISHNTEEPNEFSLQAPMVIYTNKVYNLVTLSSILSQKNFDMKFSSIQEEIVRILLSTQSDDIENKIPFLLANLLQNVSLNMKLSAVEFYYKKIKSGNKKQVQQYIKNLGVFLPIYVNLDQDQLIIDQLCEIPIYTEQIQILNTLILFYLDLSARVFEFSGLNITINNKEKFYDIFIEHNIQSSPQICQLWLQLKKLEIDVQSQRNNSIIELKTKFDQSKEDLSFYITNFFQPKYPLSIRYALSNELIRDSSSFRFILGDSKLEKLFFTVMCELVNLQQMKAILFTEHLNWLWDSIQPNFRNFALRLFENQGIKSEQELQSSVFQCGQYNSRVQYAHYLPLLIFKFTRDAQIFQQIFESIQDILVSLIKDPVRKVRTAVSRQLGVLLGEMVSNDYDVAILLKFCTQIIETNRCTIQTKCLIVNILYNAIRVSGKCDFCFILLKSLSKSNTMVKSAIVKSLVYLAKNEINIVFSEEIQCLRQFLLVKDNGQQETDLVIMMFDQQYLDLLVTYINQLE